MIGLIATNIYNNNYKTHDFDINQKTEISLNYRKWTAEEPKAVIIYVSGLQSHSQWFNDTGDYFQKENLNVYALDRRGSGLSEGLKGHIGSYKTWISDINKFIKFVKEENPELEIHLIANCFGTRLLLGHEINHPGMVDSLILLAPATQMRVDLSTYKKFILLLMNVFAPKTMFKVPLKDELFTNNEEKLEFMAQDKLTIRKTSARLLIEGEKLRKFILKNTAKIKSPVYVLMSHADGVIISDEVEEKFYKKLINARYKRLKDYFETEEEVIHFLLFEPCRDEVLEDIVTWINDENTIN